MNGGAYLECELIGVMPTHTDTRQIELEAALKYWRQVQEDTAVMITTLQRERDRKNAGRRRMYVGLTSPQRGPEPNRQGLRAAPISSVSCR